MNEHATGLLKQFIEEQIESNKNISAKFSDIDSLKNYFEGRQKEGETILSLVNKFIRIGS